MRLARLHIRRLPGIAQPFTVDAAPGVNLVVGPNEAGKSSFSRAVFDLLWPDPGGTGPQTPFSVSAEFHDAGGPLLARREDGGPVEWTRDGERADPPGLPGPDIAACYRLGLRDLIHDEGNELDRDLARRIHRQMQGGYDLQRVRDDFKSQPRAAASRRRDLLDARRRRQEVQDRQAGLAQRARGLAELEEDLVAARKAGRQLERLRQRRRARDLRDELAAVAADIARLPEAVTRVRDDDPALLTDLLERRAQQERQLADLAARLDRRQTELADLETRLGELTDADLAHCRNLLADSRASTERLREADRALDAARARVDNERRGLDHEALAEIPPAGLSPTDLSPADLRRLREHLLELFSQRMTAVRRRDLLLEMRRWRELADEATDTTSPDAASSAATTTDATTSATKASDATTTDALRAWLSGPAARKPSPAGSWLAGALLGLGTVVAATTWPGAGLPAGAGASAGPEVWLPVLGGLAVATLGVVTGLRVLMRWRRWRREARALVAICAEAGRPLPADWSVNGALQHLLDLEAQAARQAGETGLRDTLRRLLTDRLRAAEDDLAAVQTRRSEALDGHDLPVTTSESDLILMIERLARYEEALAEVQPALAARDHDGRDLAAALDGLRRRLERRDRTPADHRNDPPATAGSAGGPDATLARPDAAAELDDLAATFENLAADQRQRRELRERQQDDQDARRRAQDALATTRTDLDNLLRRLDLTSGPETLRAVVDLVALLPDYARLTERQHARRAELTAVERGLATDTDPDEPDLTEDLEPGRWETLLADLEDRAGRAQRLTDELADLKARIDLARRGRDLEQALAAEQEALAALATVRESDREAAAAALLLDVVENQYQTLTQPPLLAAASDYFQRFTRGRYRLQVIRDDGTAFIAVDNDTEEPLRLAELSDGTRAQLLLAARLAFIKRAETAVRPPLFLDEALTASDPERFAAIAEALVELSRTEQRQVFYLTSHPADVAAWQQVLAERGEGTARVIDLARLRGLAAAAPPEQIAPPVRPAVPAPDDLDPAAYARKLDVPRLDPWRPAGAAHLFHLLRDDLDLLYRLVTVGASTVGRFRGQRDDLLRAATLTDIEADHLAARGDLLDAFLGEWRVGRGRPLNGSVLAAADVLSKTMLPRAQKLLSGTGANAALFVRRLRDGGVKGLRTQYVDELAEYLEQEGYLDRREVLDEERLLAGVAGAVAEHLAAGRLAREEVRALVLALNEGAAAGSNRQAAQ